MDETELLDLRANQRFLAEEFVRRGITVRIFDPLAEVIEAVYGEHQEYLLDIDSSLVSYPASVALANKHITKLILQEANISVARGEKFESDQMAEAKAYATKLGYPVVLKPSAGSQGDGVYSGIADEQEFDEALKSIIKLDFPHGFLVEEHFEGTVVRIFITREGAYAALCYEPASVTGDGQHTVRELVDQESERRMYPRINCLGPIELDDVARKYLGKSGLDFQSVPAAGEKIFMRLSTNVSKGGTCEDFTDDIHPSLLEIAHRVLAECYDMPYIGIDLISRDPRSSQTAESYRILEVNPRPGIGVHMAPGKGQGRNIAATIADLIFPETKKHIPAISVEASFRKIGE